MCRHMCVPVLEILYVPTRKADQCGYLCAHLSVYYCRNSVVIVFVTCIANEDKSPRKYVLTSMNLLKGREYAYKSLHILSPLKLLSLYLIATGII